MSVPIDCEESTLALLERVLKMPNITTAQQMALLSMLVCMPHCDGPHWTRFYLAIDAVRRAVPL